MLQMILRKVCLLWVAWLVLAACSQTPTQAGPKVAGSATTSTTNLVEVEKTTTLEPSMTPASQPVVVVLTATPISSLDPYLMTTLHPDGSLAAHIWDSLIWLDNDLELQPGLAQSWRIVNNLTWEVVLRQGVNFHNGEPVNAEAVRFSVERARTLSGSLETFAADVTLDRVEIVDDYTVQFHTREVVADLPYYLTSLEILPPLYYGQGSANEISKTPIGSGPYQFVEGTTQDRLVLKAVPTYWAGPPAIDTLIFQPVADTSQRVNELVAGQANLITDLSPEQAKTWDPAVGRLEAIESTRRIFIGLRVEEGTPLADKRVRQALNYAIDVQAIINSLMGGYGERYGSWVNSSRAAADLAPWPFDLPKAKELLAEAGYAQGFDLILDTPIGRYHQDQAVAQAIARQLSQAGINVEVRAHEWPNYVEEYLLPRQVGPLFLLGLNSRGNAWEDTANLSFSFPFNPTNWQNAEFEQLLKEAKGTFNERQRQTLLGQAQAIAYEETPWIWLWREYNFYGVSNTLEWQPRPDGLVYLYRSASSTGP